MPGRPDKITWSCRKTLLMPHISRHAARSLRSRPFAGDGFGGKSFKYGGGSGSRPIGRSGSRRGVIGT
jgi:hypothetical protein